MSIDDRFDKYAQSLRILYDQNDCPLSKQKYRYSEIREDLNDALKYRHRASLNNV